MYKITSTDSIDISGQSIKFPCSIMKDPDGNPFIIQRDDLIIVNFYPKTSQESKGLKLVDMERNIWAFDLSGKLIWKVQPPTIRTDTKNPYTSVFEKNGKVYGGNWCGYDFEINLKDGSVTPPDKPGRPW